jgi:hypothetical protein
MIFTPINFGRHKGKTLPQIVFSDLDYFIWAFNEDIFKSSALRKEADYVYQRIRSIKIPKDNHDNYEVEYYIHAPTGKFGRFEIVEQSTPLHKGGSPAFRSKYIDLTVVKSIKDYDKSGSGIIIDCLKEYCFGTRSHKMTKKRCEDFINDDTNFVL